jgi:hypothetical protein
MVWIIKQADRVENSAVATLIIGRISSMSIAGRFVKYDQLCGLEQSDSRSPNSSRVLESWCNWETGLSQHWRSIVCKWIR